MKTFITGAALATILVTIGLLGTAARAAVSTDDFQIKTTGDLVKLCSAEPADPNYVAAAHFCQGFGAGVFQTEQLHQAATRAQPLYCVTSPMPTRAQAVAGFVKWARDNPAVTGDVPATGVLHYLIDTYPCPAKRR